MAGQIHGLIAYSPIAKNYPFEHYDDFGAQRTYGYKRQHLGHDLMAQTGTPVIAIESGIVEAVGWNQYRLAFGNTQFDGTRYHYYAHLRPKIVLMRKALKKAKVVKAKTCHRICWTHRLQYKENANNIEVPHLHLGMQLILMNLKKRAATKFD